MEIFLPYLLYKTGPKAIFVRFLSSNNKFKLSVLSVTSEVTNSATSTSCSFFKYYKYLLIFRYIPSPLNRNQPPSSLLNVACFVLQHLSHYCLKCRRNRPSCCCCLIVTQFSHRYLGGRGKALILVQRNTTTTTTTIILIIKIWTFHRTSLKVRKFY